MSCAVPGPCLSLFPQYERSTRYFCRPIRWSEGSRPFRVAQSGRGRGGAGVLGAATLPWSSRGQPLPLSLPQVGGCEAPSTAQGAVRKGPWRSCAHSRSENPGRGQVLPKVITQGSVRTGRDPNSLLCPWLCPKTQEVSSRCSGHQEV